MDKREFAERALGCAPKLHRIAYTILGREADCEDAVSEALLLAWGKLGSLRNTAYFETWLVRILINASRDMLRRRNRRRESMLSEMVPAPQPPDPALSEAILSLNIKYRLPLMMVHMEGYSIREVSAMLGLPGSTVKWRLHAAKEQLRAKLTKGDDDQ